MLFIQHDRGTLCNMTGILHLSRLLPGRAESEKQQTFKIYFLWNMIDDMTLTLIVIAGNIYYLALFWIIHTNINLFLVCLEQVKGSHLTSQVFRFIMVTINDYPHLNGLRIILRSEYLKHVFPRHTLCPPQILTTWAAEHILKTSLTRPVHRKYIKYLVCLSIDYFWVLNFLGHLGTCN